MRLEGSVGGHLKLAAPAFLLCLAIIAGVGLRSSDFFHPGNLGNLVNRVLPLALAALGETLVLIAGRIDLSVGSVISLSTTILATTSTRLGLLSLPLALLAGLACGGLNAAAVRWLKVDALIATLASSAIIEGAALILSPTPGGEVDYSYYDAFYGQDLALGWPLAVILVAFVAAFVALHFTRFGRRLYALGSDERAAYANGVDVAGMETAAFLMSGLLASAAGVAVGVKILSGDPHIGDSFTLDAISAAVLGGVALTGGRGAAPGALAGSIALVLLGNAFNLVELNPNLQQIAKGFIFVVALMLFLRGRARRAT